jgi:hypothetical protein
MAGTKKILLHNSGNYAVVDAEDYDFINSFGSWYENDQGYAVKSIYANGKKRRLRMHAVINGTPEGLVTDHINGDKLDNRRSNLRSVGSMINAWNRERQGAPHTVYDLPPGITYDKSREKYVATKTIRKRFNTLEEAVDFTRQSEKGIYGRNTRRSSQSSEDN